MVSLLPLITGSFSTPAAGNPTVAMMEAAYAHHGLDVRYLNCEVAPEGLADAVAGARAMGWIGFNCSLPHKVAVIDLIDRLDRSAQLIGAVNCVVRGADGGLTGHNTDGQGFLTSLRTVTDPAGQRVLVLGAGGAARAIAVELALAGAAHLTIANRHVDKAHQIAELVAEHSATGSRAVAWDGDLVPDDVTVVVNATSLGLPGSGPVPVVFPADAAHLVVCDVIPNPPDTDLLQRARDAGASTLDGRGMLLNQAAINFSLWTGVDPDRTVMGLALDEAIAGWEHP